MALCVATYVLVLLIELSPAFFEKWRTSPDSGLRSFAEKGLRVVKKSFVWILALGILLPTMHQSSLGTMMLLTGPKLHPLWFTPWLPFLFLVNCVIMGCGVVVLESHAAASAFGRRRETEMLARLSKVAGWVAWFFVAFRVVDVAWRGQAMRALSEAYGIAYFLFSPFPWQITSLLKLFSVPEMLLIYALTPAIYLSVWLLVVLCVRVLGL